jgi:restriction system protein
MGRKRKQSGAEDFMDVVALLPWWGGVALALVSYLVLHQMAATPKATALQSGQMADFVGRNMLAMFAFVGQLIVPFLCLFGALLSFLKRRKRQQLVANVTQSKGADSLNGMSWREFELLVGEAFRLQGYAVSEQGGAGPDGGVDIVLRKGSETFLVQCKQWKAFKVSVDVVRELYGVMAAQGAAGGFVITSGTFTADAKAFAEGRNVRLVDGPRLVGLIQQAKAARSAGAPRAPVAKASPPVSAPAPASPAAEPACPVCQSPMVRRTAKKGTNAGSQFWGCPQYPACRGTR